ncbi:conserved domain protein [Paenibacillus sp. HGF5]|nr:conserved domain protein [Paenibacillus sp. HGF5]
MRIILPISVATRLFSNGLQVVKIQGQRGPLRFSRIIPPSPLRHVNIQIIQIYLFLSIVLDLKCGEKVSNFANHIENNVKNLYI